MMDARLLTTAFVCLSLCFDHRGPGTAFEKQHPHFRLGVEEG